MNWGYGTLEKDGIYLNEHKSNPYVHSMQLYNYSVVKFGGFKDLSSKTLLEVGSGKGGGISHIYSVCNP